MAGKPQSIAIIPDGNRRWAREHSTSVSKGHRNGTDTLIEILLAAKKEEIRSLTFYGFSTENWRRHPEEVEALFAIMDAYLEANCDLMVHEGIRFHAIGDREKIPLFLQDRIASVEELTGLGSHIDFVCAINYGSRDELLRAAKKMAQEAVDQKISLNALDEAAFRNYLDTAPFNDPDLLIRTGGESRLSNFLLWQLSYAELYFTEKFWPDFTPDDLRLALDFYQQRERRLGGA